MKILVVDDSATMRLRLSARLRKWGYEVDEAEDGRAALTLFEQNNYSLVLTDWLMPGIDGIELTRRIRAKSSERYVYVLLLTARSEKTDLVEAMDAGADDFLTKPVDSEELRVRVRQGTRMISLEQKLIDKNRELRETQAALVETEKLAGLGQLAAGMAHEINNPIAFVSNNVAVLNRDIAEVIELISLYQRGKESIAKMNPLLAAEIEKCETDCDVEWLHENIPEVMASTRKGLQRVSEIVQNLRNFARLDEAAVADAELEVAVRTTVDVLRSQAYQAGVDIIVEVDDLPTVPCRPARIQQALHAVIQNAILASESGGSVRINGNVQGNHAVIAVHDQGPGIDDAVAARMFEPFFTTRSVGDGRGLGLSIAYGILKDHGGRIDFDTSTGGGTTFRLCLPLVADANL